MLYVALVLNYTVLIKWTHFKNNNINCEGLFKKRQQMCIHNYGLKLKVLQRTNLTKY